jgi:cytochrome c556
MLKQTWFQQIWKRKLTWFVLATAALAAPVLIQAQNDALRESMDNAQDAKDDLMDAVDAKQGAKISEASDKITKILTENRKFWVDKKMPDVLKMFDDTIAQSKAMSAMGKSGKLDGAKAAFTKLNASCSGCHDSHPEKKL